MKNLIALAGLLAMIVSPIQAQENSEATVYVADMTGVTWGGCKRDVSSAFKSLPGVSDVEILAGKKAGTQQVKVTSSDAGITKEAAIESLGKKAQRYVVLSWETEGGWLINDLWNFSAWSVGG